MQAVDNRLLVALSPPFENILLHLCGLALPSANIILLHYTAIDHIEKHFPVISILFISLSTDRYCRSPQAYLGPGFQFGLSCNYVTRGTVIYLNRYRLSFHVKRHMPKQESAEKACQRSIQFHTIITIIDPVANIDPFSTIFPVTIFLDLGYRETM